MELFVFIYNLVFKSVFYNGMSKIPFLFELVLRLHQIQMRGDLILNLVHIAGTRIIETGID